MNEGPSLHAILAHVSFETHAIRDERAHEWCDFTARPICPQGSRSPGLHSDRRPWTVKAK